MQLLDALHSALAVSELEVVRTACSALTVMIDKVSHGIGSLFVSLCVLYLWGIDSAAFKRCFSFPLLTLLPSVFL